jgi:prevent-host-death family protein
MSFMVMMDIANGWDLERRRSWLNGVVANHASLQTAERGLRQMGRLSVVELKNSLSDVLNRAEYKGERIIVHRRDKDAAAIVSLDDLRLLERLVEEAEDREDVAAVTAARAESDERIPYARVRTTLGLDDRGKKKKRSTKL